ncbi:hypothetical protein QBC35DRAFT_553406 [Podospora australis]|uniref:Uncharacterized protein n=1 Tax=Podospora australis TaxID=1536484 RepID=A0AAN7AFJ8_9PEZI|nr:hypothetical protein QBC35DRAFT_553406 [Podospora australis]
MNTDSPLSTPAPVDESTPLLHGEEDNDDLETQQQPVITKTDVNGEAIPNLFLATIVHSVALVNAPIVAALAIAISVTLRHIPDGHYVTWEPDLYVFPFTVFLLSLVTALWASGTLLRIWFRVTLLGPLFVGTVFQLTLAVFAARFSLGGIYDLVFGDAGECHRAGGHPLDPLDNNSACHAWTRHFHSLAWAWLSFGLILA